MTASKWLGVALWGGGTIVLDQLTKLAATEFLAPVGLVKIIPGFLNLAFVLNPGAAFGLFGGQPGGSRIIILTALAAAALGVVVLLLVGAKPRERLFVAGLAMTAGGAVGNIIDRLRLGSVIDFVDVFVSTYHWPTFNVADIGITVGAGLIVIHLWKQK
ncbi:MAG: signal peptidase II [Pseudomonadota bacterium]